MPNLSRSIEAVRTALAYGAVGCGLLAGVATLAYQVYIWMRFAVWQSFSVITMLQWGDLPWALNPRDWLGWHKALDTFPMALAFPLLGVLVALVVHSDETKSRN